MRAASRSFSSRALTAIALTASNSSRCTTSMSRRMRSPCDLHQRLELAAHALGGAGRVGHQLGELVEEAVVGLGHGASLARHGRVGGSAYYGGAALCALQTAPVVGFPRLDRSLPLTDRSRHMSLLAIPFPEIDPVALQARADRGQVVRARLHGRPAARLALCQAPAAPGPRCGPATRPPFTPDKADDLLLYMTVGVLVGGRLGYVLFYEPRYYLQQPAGDPRGLEGRHGVPRRRSIGSIIAIVLFARRIGVDAWSVLDAVRGGHADRPVLRAACQLHQRRAVGPADRACPGPWCFRSAGPRCPRHPSQLYEAALEGLVLFARAVVAGACAGWRCSGPASSPARSWPATAWRARSASCSASPISACSGP